MPRTTLLATALAAIALLIPVHALAQTGATAVIYSPQPGEAISGKVQIRGTADSPAFAAAELAFSYASDDTRTWFTLQEIDRAVRNSDLATWDTTAITDGDYILRLSVMSSDGSSAESTVALQVRNYTAAEPAAPTATATRAASVQVPGPVDLATATMSAPTPPPSPTALPPNPAALSTSSIYGIFWRAAAAVAVLVVLLGLFFLRRPA